MNIAPLIILIALVFIVMFIVRDRTSSLSLGPPFFGAFLVIVILQFMFLNMAVFISLNLLESLIFVPVTFENVIKIATSIYLVYFSLSIKLKLTI